MMDTQLAPTSTANSDGVAVVRFNGPGPSYESLHVSSIQLQGDSDTLPTAKLYRGSDATGRLLATEADGNDGGFDGGGATDRLDGSDSWSIVWTDCTPGAEMTAVLVGYVARRR